MQYSYQSVLSYQADARPANPDDLDAKSNLNKKKTHQEVEHLAILHSDKALCFGSRNVQLSL